MLKVKSQISVGNGPVIFYHVYDESKPNEFSFGYPSLKSFKTREEAEEYIKQQAQN